MKIFPLLVLSLNFLLVTKTNGFVVDRSKRQAIDRKDNLETGLATIKLTTTTGISCGGFYVFAQICKENGIGKKIALKNNYCTHTNSGPLSNRRPLFENSNRRRLFI